MGAEMAHKGFLKESHINGIFKQILIKSESIVKNRDCWVKICSVKLWTHDQTKLNLRGIVKIIVFGFKKHFWGRHMGAEMAHKGVHKEFLKEALIKAILQAKFDQNA